MIEAGALTHVWLGETPTARESLANFVVKIFQQHAERPDRLLARVHHLHGLRPDRAAACVETCPYCGSGEVDGITRITGYFTKISSWNKGKLGELKDRYRNPGFTKTQEAEEAKAV